MADFCQRAYLNIDGAEIECASIDEDLDLAVEVIETMARDNRAKGYKSGVPKFSLSVEMPLDFDVEELKSSLEQKALRGEVFTAHVEVESQAGLPSIRSYIDCRIKSQKDSAKIGDGVSRTLEILALDKTIS